MLFVVLCPGTPEGSTGSGSGFKASQKMGNGLKSHPTDWEKPGIEPATPGLQDIGLSPTPRWLLSLKRFAGVISGIFMILYTEIIFKKVEIFSYKLVNMKKMQIINCILEYF